MPTKKPELTALQTANRAMSLTDTAEPTERMPLVPRHLDDSTAKLATERFTAYQMGLTWNEIAEIDGVGYNIVRSHIFYCLAQIPAQEGLKARNNHLAHRLHNDLAGPYFDELKKLMTEGKWVQRSKALEHFRRTVGLQGESVNVTVDNRNQSVQFGQGAQHGSFESFMRQVRTTLKDEDRQAQDVLDAELVGDAQGVTIEADDHEAAPSGSPISPPSPPPSTDPVP